MILGVSFGKIEHMPKCPASEKESVKWGISKLNLIEIIK